MLVWQGRESQDSQSKPLNLLTVWDWSVQFEPKSPGVVHKPSLRGEAKTGESQRKGTHFKVRFVHV